MAAPSEIRRSASPRFVAPHTKGTVKGHLSMWYASSAGVSTSDSSMKSTPSDCSTCASAKCPMRALAMTGMVTASMIPSISSGSLMRATPPSRRMSAGHPLERHDRDGTGVLGDLGLLGVDDVHDDAAPQHVGQSPLDGEGPGGHGSSLRGQAAPSHHSLSAAALTDVASRSPGTSGVVAVAHRRVDPHPAGRPEAGGRGEERALRSGRAPPSWCGARRAGRGDNARPTRPRRRLDTPGSPPRSAAASSRRRRAVPSVIPTHETPLSPRFTWASSWAITPSSSMGSTRRRSPVVTTRSDRRGVATERAGVGHVVVHDVERRHAQAEGGAQALGHVGEARVVVLVDRHGTDPPERHRGGEPPHAVHDHGAGRDEARRCPTIGETAAQNRTPNRMAGMTAVQAHSRIGAPPVGGHLAGKDLGGAQARFDVDRLERWERFERHGGTGLPLPAARSRPRTGCRPAAAAHPAEAGLAPAAPGSLAAAAPPVVGRRPSSRRTGGAPVAVAVPAAVPIAIPVGAAAPAGSRRRAAASRRSRARGPGASPASRSDRP